MPLVRRTSRRTLRQANPVTTMIFDLDGTLVQTEKLKARSYARAAVELCGSSLDEQDVIEDSPAG